MELDNIPREEMEKFAKFTNNIKTLLKEKKYQKVNNLINNAIKKYPQGIINKCLKLRLPEFIFPMEKRLPFLNKLKPICGKQKCFRDHFIIPFWENFKEGHYHKAQKYAEELYKLDPTYALYLIYVKIKMGKVPSIKLFKKIPVGILNTWLQATYYYCLGIRDYHHKKISQAEANLRKAYDLYGLKKGCKKGYHILGVINFNKGYYSLAADFFKRSLKIPCLDEINLDKFKVDYAEALFYSGDRTAAIKIFKKYSKECYRRSCKNIKTCPYVISKFYLDAIKKGLSPRPEMKIPELDIKEEMHSINQNVKNNNKCLCQIKRLVTEKVTDKFQKADFWYNKLKILLDILVKAFFGNNS